MSIGKCISWIVISLSFRHFRTIVNPTIVGHNTLKNKYLNDFFFNTKYKYLHKLFQLFKEKKILGKQKCQFFANYCNKPLLSTRVLLLF